MIPVSQQAEPSDFNIKVRVPGQQWLANNPNATSTEIHNEAHWKACSDDLYHAYDGICAYISIFIDKVTGSPNTDHFIPVSTDKMKAYEWSNYRLSCWCMNRAKNRFGVLDPFTLPADTFFLDFLDGRIYPNPQCSVDINIAQQTINRLKLDEAACRDMRMRRFNMYIAGELPAAGLMKEAPFVWYEAKRQGLL